MCGLSEGCHCSALGATHLFQLLSARLSLGLLALIGAAFAACKHQHQGKGQIQGIRGFPLSSSEGEGQSQDCRVGICAEQGCSTQAGALNVHKTVVEHDCTPSDEGSQCLKTLSEASRSKAASFTHG